MGSRYPSGDCTADIAEIIITGARILESIRVEGPQPYIMALEHCLRHVASGGTADNLQPLIRTPDYAGLDRRSKTPKVPVYS